MNQTATKPAKPTDTQYSVLFRMNQEGLYIRGGIWYFLTAGSGGERLRDSTVNALIERRWIARSGGESGFARYEISEEGRAICREYSPQFKSGYNPYEALQAAHEPLELEIRVDVTKGLVQPQIRAAIREELERRNPRLVANYDVKQVGEPRMDGDIAIYNFRVTRLS